MATGTNGSRTNSKAIIAEMRDVNSFPLPGGNDKFAINYPNKATEKEILNSQFEGELVKIRNGEFHPEISGVDKNSIIVCDNFYALKELIKQYKNQVTLIYLDPPYRTGMQFSSRSQTHAYEDSMDLTSWIEFIRRRLILMRELLNDRGSIYLHIGHQMLFHTKILMDEIFGEKNFQNLIVRKKCSSKNYTRNRYPNLNDYILFYSKTDNYTWNQPGVPPTKEWINKEYTKRDKKGRFKLVPIHAPGVRNGKTGEKWRGIDPPPGKHWQYIPDKLDELDEKGEIHWSKNGNPRRKVYLSKNKTLPLTDYWEDFRDAHHQSIKITGYPTEKNFEMLKMIVEASSNEGDLVLDPFCGSGTTLHACKDLKRNYIGIDQSLVAAKATIDRLYKGPRKMGDYVNNEFDQKQIDLKLFDSKFDFNIYFDKKLTHEHKEKVKSLTTFE
jgi:adenine-specific DNA-methyltransferase